MRANVVAKPGWILERLARELAPLGATLNAGRAERAVDPQADLHYYLPARDILKFPHPRGLAVGLYTHGVSAFDIAHRFDAAVTMNLAMAELVRQAGARRVVTIRPGVDPPTAPPQPPRETGAIVFGVCGRVYGKRRKGEHLVRAAVAAGFRFVACSNTVGPRRRQPCPITHQVERRSEFYRAIDCLVVPSTEEGGPMPVPEAMAHDVPIVVPIGVGWCDEFPAAARYTCGDVQSLLRSLRGVTRASLAEARRVIVDRRSVQPGVDAPTWAAWTEEHRRLFAEIGAGR